MNYKHSLTTLLLGAGLAVTNAHAQPADPYAGTDAGKSSGDAKGASDTGKSSNDAKPANDSETEARAIPSVDLLFDTDSATLKSDAHQELRRLATWAKCTPKGALILEGHADKRGTDQHNMKLAADRVAIVREKLVKMGVPSERLVVTVYGEHGPTRDTLAENRRVTVRATARPIESSDIPAPS